MAGVAFAVDGDGVGFATESYAASALYTTLANLSGAFWRIRRASFIGVSARGSACRAAQSPPVHQPLPRARPPKSDRLPVSPSAIDPSIIREVRGRWSS